MMIQLTMGSEFRDTVRSLSRAGERIQKAVSSGLDKGLKDAAGHVTSSYLSGQYLNRRSGQLAESVDGWLAKKFEGVIGVKPASAVDKYKYQLGDEVVTIRPKKGKYLAIR